MGNYFNQLKEVYWKNEMELNGERLSNFLSDFKNFWVDLKVGADANKLTKWYKHFEKDYLEVFTLEMEVNKAAVQPHREKKLERSKKDFYRIGPRRDLLIMKV